MSTVRAVVADDHALVRAGIVATLKDMPDLEIVREVADGPGLFMALADEQPDLLLADIAMPDFEPISAIRKIRELYPRMKILVISAHDDDRYVDGLFRAGVHGYQLKDQPLGDLLPAVRRVMDGGRWVCDPVLEQLLRFHETTPRLDPSLTRRQRELLRYLQQGLDNLGIARRTGLSVKTIENHLTRLYRLLGVQTRLEAANYVSQHPEVLGPSERTSTVDMLEPDQPTLTSVDILVVDDHPRYRAQLRGMIGTACPQAQIHEAEDTQAAVVVLERVAPQLALIDMVLGHESGMDCTRSIRERSPSTRIVVLSAYPDRAFHRLAIEAGAVAFVDKTDLDASTLRELIEDVIH